MLDSVSFEYSTLRAEQFELFAPKCSTTQLRGLYGFCHVWASLELGSRTSAFKTAWSALLQLFVVAVRLICLLCLVQENCKHSEPSNHLGNCDHSVALGYLGEILASGG